MKIPTIFITSFIIIALGIVYGVMFHKGKQYLFNKKQPMVDYLFTIVRILLLFVILYSMSEFIQADSILLSILFVSSYLCTLAVLTYNS